MLGSRFGSSSAYASNSDLCGPPSESECGVYRRRRRRQRVQRLALLFGVVAAAALLVALFCCCCVFSLMGWRRRIR
uniref:Uncharacterized protein n=1 Tax=Zea mays TaxID=4577 RepID=A0A804P0V5_MAIZE